MKEVKEFKWWAYLLAGVLLCFTVPWLVSAPDTVMVIVGIILMVVYAVVSWKFWIRPLIVKIWESVNEDL